MSVRTQARSFLPELYDEETLYFFASDQLNMKKVVSVCQIFNGTSLRPRGNYVPIPLI